MQPNPSRRRAALAGKPKGRVMTTATQPAPRELRHLPIPSMGQLIPRVLDGSKTQTRRIISPQPELLGVDLRGAERLVVDRNPWRAEAFKGTPAEGALGHGQPEWVVVAEDAWRNIIGTVPTLRCPYGAPGDLLWVREGLRRDEAGLVRYAATDDFVRHSGEAVEGRLPVVEWPW